MTRDLRQFKRQTGVRLVFGALFLLFFVGGGLIWVIYGPGPAAFGLLCLGAVMLPIAAISFVMGIVEWITRYFRERE